MIRAIRKRPMIRLLLVWMTGILLQSQWEIGGSSLFLLVIPFVLLLVSFVVKRKTSFPTYSLRWVWGVAALSFFLFLAVLFTEWRQQHPVLPASSQVQQSALRLRDKLVDRIDRLNLPEEEKMVLATVTLGYRQRLSPQTRQAFTVTGSAHILAVSGMHVGIVCSFLTLLFSLFAWGRRRNLFVFAVQILCLWGYVFVTGCAASALRAGWMLSFFLIGRQLIKTTDSYNTLAASAFCMLVYNPFYLFDIGFQLSCLAVFFILYLSPFLKSFFPLRNPLLSVPVGWVTVACAAQLGLTLLCLWYFRSVTLLFLFSTLPVMAMVACLMPVALSWLLLPAWFPGTGLLQLIVEKLTRWFCRMIYSFSEIKGMELTFSPALWQVILGYVVLIAFIEYLRSRKKNSVKSNTFELLN